MVADDLIDEYAREGYKVTVRLRTPDLVQMEVTDVSGHRCNVDLGVFWQARSPVPTISTPMKVPGLRRLRCLLAGADSFRWRR